MFLNTNIPYSFAGIKKPLEKCKVVIVPVPYDSTTTFRGGTRDGPHAMIVASRQFEDYDIELQKEIGNELGFFTSEEVEPDTNSPQGMTSRVEDAVKSVLDLNKFPVVFGGEHSITLGIAKAFSAKYKKFSVLQIDAHADLRDEYQGSKLNHACVMRRIRELKEVDSVVQVGIRSLCSEEAEFIKNQKISDYVHYGNKFDVKKVLKKLGENVLISIDLDGLDPSIMPAVGTPEPGGLGWYETLGLLKEVAKEKKIIGFDVNELAPLPGNPASDLLAAKLAYKLIGYSFYAKQKTFILPRIRPA